MHYIKLKQVKRALPVLIVLVNLIVFSGIVFVIVQFEYREDEYGIPSGTPVTGLVILLKLLLVMVLQIALNLIMGKQSSNKLVTNGMFLSGIVLGILLVVLVIRLLSL
jgi:magnesium-transporting ATPase (P-type)